MTPHNKELIRANAQRREMFYDAMEEMLELENQRQEWWVGLDEDEKWIEENG